MLLKCCYNNNDNSNKRNFLRFYDLQKLATNDKHTGTEKIHNSKLSSIQQLECGEKGKKHEKKIFLQKEMQATYCKLSSTCRNRATP